MPKGVPNKKYTAEFKKLVVETMRTEQLSYSETARRFGVTGHQRIQSWEQIYLTFGPEGFLLERRGRNTKISEQPVLLNTTDSDLLKEVQRLRAENDYLKNLQALVLESEQHRRKKRR